MRLLPLSDLHLEHGALPPNYVPPEADVVILAGDIGEGLQGIRWAKEAFDQPVIFVPGNHDVWRSVMSESLAAMREEARGSNVHFLDGDTITIDGVRFIGAALWTDYNLFSNAPMSSYLAQQGIKDFAFKDDDGKFIGFNMMKTATDPIIPQDLIDIHNDAKRFIVGELEKKFDGPTVVVTHHAPSVLSISDQFSHHPLSPAYASKLEDIILDFQPELWIHGHTHTSFDYQIGETRVVCNPRGYRGYMMNGRFDPQMIIGI